MFKRDVIRHQTCVGGSLFSENGKTGYTGFSSVILEKNTVVPRIQTSKDRRFYTTYWIQFYTDWRTPCCESPSSLSSYQLKFLFSGQVTVLPTRWSVGSVVKFTGILNFPTVRNHKSYFDRLRDRTNGLPVQVIYRSRPVVPDIQASKVWYTKG